jgi:hypothetical protein
LIWPAGCGSGASSVIVTMSSMMAYSLM